jgi:Cu/Ag efflux protein CusF
VPQCSLRFDNRTITAIDAAKGTVPSIIRRLAALRWPGMTMSFAATAEQLKDLKVEIT